MLWQSTTAAAGSIVPVPGYAAAGGVTPTGLVLDPRSQLRYFVADNTNLFGTTNQGGSFTNLAANLSAGIIRPTALEFISNNGPATVSELRQALGSSRRVMVPLL